MAPGQTAIRNAYTIHGLCHRILREFYEVARTKVHFKIADEGLLKRTKSITEVDPTAYDAIFLAGGQSPMVTMINDTALHTFVVKAYEAGKIVSIVCHGTCILLKTKLSNGDLLVKGKTWTGFANSEEAYADAWVGQKIQPFWIEDEARKIEGTNFIVSGMFKPFAVRDGNLITGQQQFSGGTAAELVVQALGK